MDWNAADKIALDDELSRQFFTEGNHPDLGKMQSEDDPVSRGFERNLPLCAFHWVLRRFMEATKYCLVSDLYFARLTAELRLRSRCTLSTPLCL